MESDEECYKGLRRNVIRVLEGCCKGCYGECYAGVMRSCKRSVIRVLEVCHEECYEQCYNGL